MSTEIYALFNEEVHSAKDWQNKIGDLGFHLEFKSPPDIKTLSGFLPAQWQGQEAGFECSPKSLSDLQETYSDFDLRGPWRYVYAFYFHTLPGCVGACMAAAGMITGSDGVVFETHNGLILSAEEATAMAARTEANVLDMMSQLSKQT